MSNPTNTIRIVAAVVDTTHLTLYKADGQTLQFEQGDERIRPIIDEITPLLISQGYADIAIRAADTNHYAAFEEQTGGMVRFFRIAKERLSGLFRKPKPENTEPVAPMIIGKTPTTTIVDDVEDAPVGPATQHLQTAGIYEVSEADEVAAAEERAAHQAKLTGNLEVQQMRTAVDEIMQHAVPVTSPDFHEITVAKQGDIVNEEGITDQSTKDSDHPDTIVAMIEGKLIPGMEKIKTQFARAAKLGSTTGVENFLKRLVAIIDQRKHSVDDLLKFMERADMPIADDGSIIIYKVLRYKGDRTDGKYVDCHTGKVEQWTGAYVCMDPALVDPNRRNECSNGLHVARRGYLRGFPGDVCVLAKLAPEDVIAVPEYDGNKMRVCGYHILAELSEAQYALVRQNKPITDDPKGKVLLANALAGKHVVRTHEVRITGHMGQNVQVKKLTAPVPIPVIQSEVPAITEAVALTNPGDYKTDVPVDPKTVIEKVEQAVSKKEQAKQLYDAWVSIKKTYGQNSTGEQVALDRLIAFKKTSKKGWNVLGIPDPTAAAAKPQAKVKTKAKGKKKGKGKTKPIQFKEVRTVPDVFKNPQVADVVLDSSEDRRAETHAPGLPAPSKGSFRDRIHNYIALGINMKTATMIFALKRQSKKSWATLGVDDARVEQILKLINKK
jgi:hypothetical protein